MMIKNFLAALIALGLLAAWSAEADAYSFRIAQYPNGDCNFCHVFPGGPRTSFGLSVQATLQGGNVNWPAIFAIDSDGDGYTNGEELGDPNGVWVRGNVNPRLLSEPQDAFDVPALVGQRPTLTNAAVTVNEDTTLQGVLGAVDPDGGTLRFRVVTSPTRGTLVITNRVTGAYTYTPNANYFGSDAFTFQVFDGNNIAVAPGQVAITVAPVNDAPSIATDGNQAVLEDETISFSVSGADVEDGEVGIEIEGLPEGATFDAEAGVFSWTPTFFQAGDYTVTFIAVDNDGGATAEEVEIEVINVNRPPVIDLLQGLQVGNEGDTLTFTASASDLDLEALTYTWSYGDGAQASGVGLTAVSHAYPRDGALTLTLTVSDGIDTDSGTLAITLQNVLPEVSVGGDLSANEGDAVLLSGQFFDPGTADQHIIIWQYGDGGQRQGQLEVSHAYADNGTFTATLIVSDEVGADSDALVVTVQNVAPVANAGGNRTINEGTPFTFPGQFTDPGTADQHTYLWDFGDGGTDTQRQPTHAFADQGTFTASFRVSDDDGGSDADTIAVTVLNVAPQVTSRPVLYAILEELYVYQVTAIDLGDDTVSYALIDGPEGMVMDDAGRITYTPALEEQDNIYDILIHVTDEDGGLTAHAFELRVGLPDRDGDGADDECEERFNRLDPDDPDDGPQDFDGDGLTNAEECQDDTNPLVSNAPTAPSVNAPFTNQLVNTPNVTLIVNNGVDPDGDPVTYFFEVYRDSALTQRAGLYERVPAGQNVTRVTLDFALTEDAAYYWRARAYDGNGYSAFTAVANFRFSLFNDPPSVPVHVSPNGIVDQAPVVFTVRASIDPEREIPVGYDFQIFDDAMMLHDSILGLPGRGDTVDFVSTRPFEENKTYTWRARATDVRGISSAFSEPQAFVINLINSLPPAPALVSPELNATIDAVEGLRFIAEAVEDEDNDLVTYAFRVSTTNTFDPGTVIATQEGVQADGNGQVTFQALPETPVEENKVYFWDARAYDGENFGPQSIRSFRFSVENEPPSKVTLQSPADGTSIGQVDPDFVWANVLDPEETPVTYTLEVFADEALRDRVRQLNDVVPTEGSDMTTAQVAELDNNTTYRWRVRGTDADGVEGEWSDVATFTVSTAGLAPGAPTVFSPVEEEVFNKGEEIDLVWENAEDPERGALLYDVEVLNNAGQVITGKSVPESATGQGLTSYILEVSLAPASYTWRVRADDGAQKGPWSDSGSFRVVEIIPPAPKKEGCAAVAPAAGAPAGLPLIALLALGLLALARRRR